jgi:hypothetical protein
MRRHFLLLAVFPLLCLLPAALASAETVVES